MEKKEKQIKKTATLVEKIADTTNSTVYKANKRILGVVSNRVQTKEASIYHLSSKKQNIENRINAEHPSANFGQLYDLKDSDKEYSSTLNKYLRKQDQLGRLENFQEYLITKTDNNNSSSAAYDRLIDSTHIYETVSELLADRVIVEKFRPSGKSSFDFKIDIDRVSSINDKETIDNLLRYPTVKTAQLNEESIATIFAFGDAKLIGEIHTDGFLISVYGKDLQRRVAEIRKDNADTAKATAKTGEDMKSYLAEDKKLAELEKMTEIMTISATQYYNNMIDMIPEI